MGVCEEDRLRRYWDPPPPSPTPQKHTHTHTHTHCPNAEVRCPFMWTLICMLLDGEKVSLL